MKRQGASLETTLGEIVLSEMPTGWHVATFLRQSENNLTHEDLGFIKCWNIRQFAYAIIDCLNDVEVTDVGSLDGALEYSKEQEKLIKKLRKELRELKKEGGQDG